MLYPFEKFVTRCDLLFCDMHKM